MDKVSRIKVRGYKLSAQSGRKSVSWFLDLTLPWSRSSRACIGTTNLTITLQFILDVTPTSRADRIFSIAFAAQWRERMSRDRDAEEENIDYRLTERDISTRGVHHGL